MQVLIIGGTHKAGTTSLFKYLSSHNRIATPFIKQTYFFQGHRDGIKKFENSWTYESHGGHALEHYYKATDKGKYCLDATPDYLGDLRALSNVCSFKADGNTVKIIFVLRNPVDRLISWFNYSKQLGVIDSHVTIEEYLELQVEDDQAHEAFRALYTGKYFMFLDKWLNNFTSDEIRIVEVKDLHINPTLVMKRLMSFLDLDSSVYKNYTFSKQNVTRQEVSIARVKFYIPMRRLVFNILNYSPGLFRVVYSTLSPLIESMSSRRARQHEKSKDDSQDISSEIRKWLESYYEEDQRFLQLFLEENPFIRCY